MSNNDSTDQPKEIYQKKETVKSTMPKTNKTRISTAWFMTVCFILALVLLLIFVLQNLQDVPIRFISFHWRTPLGIAMLLSAVVGGFVVAFFGTARVIQLGHRLRKNKN